MFDFLSYMDGLCKANRLAQDQSFIHSTCSGINYVKGMLEQYQTTANFLCTSDVCSESTFLSSGGWFKRRVYMVFVLMRYEYGRAYRYEHHLGKARERKPWFNKSWYISVEILKNHLASILGDQFAGAFDTLTEKERG